MGAKINAVIKSVEVQDEYSPGTHTFENVSVEFHSTSDILIIKQGNNEIAMELIQTGEFLKIMAELNDKI